MALKYLTYIALLLVIVFSSQSFAYLNISGGFSISNHSEVLNEQRQVKVYLPPNYEHSNVDYPVLYVLDGQWHFINAVAVQHSLKSPLAIPEMIVVAVINQNPERRSWFGRKREVFGQYVIKELIPYIDKNYRTQERRVLFGWEMSAFFSSYLFVNHPNTFEGIILSNGGEIDESELKTLDSKLNNDKYLYIANSDRDVYTVSYSNDLSKKLQENPISKLHWKLDKFNDETHQTTPYLALYKGLKYIFHNYSIPEFIDISEFKQRGGVPYLNKYFIERSERFGFEQTIDDKTKNHLIWLSWNQNNYPEFDSFMVQFDDVLKTKRYDSIFWQNNFALFYLKHGNTKQAEQYFSRAIEKFPESALLYNGLGKVYKQKGIIKKAKENFSTAIKVATEQNDKNLAQYKLDLASLNNS